MNVRFYLDPETEEPHIYNHGVSADELKTSSALRVKTVQVGRVPELLTVKPGPVILAGDRCSDSEPQSVFVITAYELSGRPLVVYRRCRRRRGT